jgi:hypothetical protein
VAVSGHHPVKGGADWLQQFHILSVDCKFNVAKKMASCIISGKRPCAIRAQKPENILEFFWQKYEFHPHA